MVNIMKIILKMAMPILAIGLIIYLSSCGRNNPMIKEEIINNMKGKLVLESPIFPIKECSQVYADQMSGSQKEICDKWSEDYYKGLFRNGGLPTDTTLD